MSTNVRLEVVVGAGTPSSLELRAGQARNPFTAGSGGNWRLLGAGLAAMHVSFYFDGATLYVASVDNRWPALLNGVVVPADWVQVSMPSQISVGSVVIAATATPVADTFSDETIANAPGIVTHPPSERTRVAPVEAFTADAPPATVPIPMPATVRKPVDGSAQAFGPSGTLAFREVSAAEVMARHGAGATPGHAPGLAPAPAPAASPSPFAFWHAASLPKRITYILLPFALIAGAYVILADDTAAPKRARTAPSASASTSASAPPASPPIASARPPTPPPPPTVTDDATPPPRGAGGAGGRSKTTDARAKRTPERQAVDLIAAGAYADAAKMLDEMAAASPDHPEYRDAARVLRAKAKESGP